MSIRSSAGWLTPEALRAGEREQYAIERWPHTHTVILEWAGLGTAHSWRVKRILSRRDGTAIEIHEYHCAQLNEARERFTIEKRRTRA